MLTHRFNIIISVISAILIALTMCPSSLCQEGIYRAPGDPGGEKVAVLYFTDHSGFDSGGCLSIWPLSVIFGTGQKRERWDLKSGFRDMLNEKLIEAGYNIIEPGHIEQVLKETDKDNLPALADRLGADIMIAGDITKFEQHRTRASSQGPTTVAAGADTRMVAMGGIGGFFYSSTVKTDITIYDGSGEELENSEVNSKKNLRDFYMGVGLLTYHRGESGEESQDTEVKDPIVDYRKLDAMKFGSDEFRNRTLFGIATTDVMEQMVRKVEEYMEPPELANVQGKIIFVGTGERLRENEVYIDLGAGDGMRTGHRLGVYVGELKLTDPDTGEELGTVPEKKVGAIRISRVEADHLSLAEIVEGTGQIERGNIVKRE